MQVGDYILDKQTKAVYYISKIESDNPNRTARGVRVWLECKDSRAASSPEVKLFYSATWMPMRRVKRKFILLSGTAEVLYGDKI